MANEVRQDVNIQVHTSGTSSISELNKQIDNLNKSFQNMNNMNFEDLFKFGDELNNIKKSIKDIEKLDLKDLNINYEDLLELDSTLDEVTDELNNLAKTNIDMGVSVPEGMHSYIDDIQERYDDATRNMSGSTVDLSSAVNFLGRQFGLTNTQASSFAKALGASAGEIALVSVAAAALIKVFKEVYDVTGQVLDTLKDIGVSLGKFVANLGVGTLDAFVSGLNMMTDAFSDLIDFSKEAIDQLQEFADIGGEVQDSYFKIYQYLGEKAGADIIDYTNKLGMLLNIDTSKLLKGMKGILAVTSQLGVDADGVTKYTKALNNFALDLSAFSGESIENIASQFENAINLGVLNSRSAIAKALDLTDSDIEQFRSLNTELERTNFLLMRGSSVQGLYQKYMDTSVGKVAQLKNAWQNFLNTVGQLALQIYAIVAPVLTKLINLATYAVQAVAKFFNIDLSTKGGGLASPISNEAADTAGRYADNVGKAGKAIEDTAKKAKDATKKVASFDDVIQINDDKSTEQKNKDAADLIDNLKDIQNYDPAPWVDSFNDAMDGLEVPDFSFDSLRDKLKELLDDFKNWEEAIDWDYWRKKAADFGTELAKLANVIVDDEQAWRDLGDLIGNSLNVGLEFLNAFAKEFHFEQFGKDLAVAFKEIFNQLDEDLAAETIYNWLTGALDMAIGFFSEKPLTTAAASISSIIAKLINSLSSDESKAQVLEFINVFFADVLGAINSTIATFELNDTVDKLGEIIYNAFLGLGKNTPEIVETVSRMMSFLLDTIGTSISSAIDGLFTGLEEDPEGVDKIVNALIGVINSVFENIGKIGDAISEHKDTIIKLITDFVNSLFENAESWGLEVQPLVDAIVEIIRSIDFTKIRGAISTFLENAHIEELIQQWIMTLIKMAITKAWITLEQAIGSLGVNITTAISNVFDTINDLNNAFIGGILALILNSLGVAQEDIQGILDGIFGITDGFFNSLESLINTAINLIITPFELLFDTLSALFTGNFSKFEETAKRFVNSFTGIFKGLGESLEGLVKTIFESIKTLWNNTLGGISIDIPDWIPKFGGSKFEIPKLAIGAIVEKSTIANIGEDGAEAVLPLQKNTEWMDALASKLASQMNENGNAGGTVNIQMSNKNFYTRSEMLDFADQVVKALKVYGVNVSVAY